ncbi:hypothetical protein [Methylobacterium komagatae]
MDFEPVDQRLAGLGRARRPVGETGIHRLEVFGGMRLAGHGIAHHFRSSHHHLPQARPV